MDKPKPQKQPVKNTKANPAESREDRLKAALKANMGRRKAQARVRASTNTERDQS